MGWIPLKKDVVLNTFKLYLNWGEFPLKMVVLEPFLLEIYSSVMEGVGVESAENVYSDWLRPYALLVKL